MTRIVVALEFGQFRSQPRSGWMTVARPFKAWIETQADCVA